MKVDSRLILFEPLLIPFAGGSEMLGTDVKSYQNRWKMSILGDIHDYVPVCVRAEFGNDKVTAVEGGFPTHTF